MEYQEAVSARYSAYMLDDDIASAGVTMDDVIRMLETMSPNVPSSFNAQSVRMVILAGEDHRRFWAIVEDILRRKVGDEQRFRKTEIKLRNFAKAAGTILFYEIDSSAASLAEQYPSYADAFPVWAEHGNAMMQFAVWTAMYDIGLGANIQHYNPIVDDAVREEFGIPEGYRLVAQLVFGRIAGESERKDKLPGSAIVSVGHSNKGGL